MRILELGRKDPREAANSTDLLNYTDSFKHVQSVDIPTSKVDIAR
jgi:hypothetical protein